MSDDEQDERPLAEQIAQRRAERLLEAQARQRDEDAPNELLSPPPREFDTGTIGVTDAARLLRMSEDALMRKARAGIVPGAKIGREWVFVQIDLIEHIRQQAQKRAESATHTQRLGHSSLGDSLAEKIERERRERLRAQTPEMRALRRTIEQHRGGSPEAETARKELKRLKREQLRGRLNS